MSIIMHGREGEKRSQSRHMWPVPASASSSVAANNFIPITPDSFSKDGRKIHVGDCALFKPPQDSPPFVGIIRRLILGKDHRLILCVSWLYRPADVKLGKGVLLEAAPNEVFYSFHKDEIPAASLLHPCKVAFLRKGVELPSGTSSFVCRQVYDIENKCLWWLTDQDYVNSSLMQERQEEVDKLLDKTQIEMYGAVQSGGRSPKNLNGSTGTQQLKPGSDSAQNSSSSFPSQAKGKKREQTVQGSDPVKRERTSRVDDDDSCQMLKSEIAKITDKGGLVDYEGVEKLVQLMQPDGAEKKMDLACRIMLVTVIAVTDRYDCLGRFVQLRGLPVLDDWLQEAHKGKIGDGSSPKESDRSVEEFLLALLRALDKLPVNLHALQTCNVGKSVNHLRTHKNSEIQKKARSLVDTWKKRVEAEMNMIDAKSGSNRGGTWPTKSVISEVSQVCSRRTGGSSDSAVKGSNMQSCASKTPPANLASGEKFSAASPAFTKLSTSVTATSGVASSKDLNSESLVAAGSSDVPLTTIKEEKSTSSSQSQNNSQSCSSDYGKNGASCREDARSSTAGSMSINKISGGVSRNRKSSNGLHGKAVLGVQKESGLGKFSSVSRNSAPEKVSPTRVTSERTPDAPVDNTTSQRLIVRLPNTGRSPAQSASGGSPEDASATVCKGSPLAHSEKLEHHDRKIKGKSEALRSNSALNVTMDLCPGKDGFVGSNEVNVSSAGVLCDEQSRVGELCEKLTEALKGTGSPAVNIVKPGKSYEASFSSINALIESCVKFSEASASASVGDDVGMNLLASVAAEEISRADVSPLSSPGGKSPVPEDLCSGNDVKLRHIDEDRARSEDHRDDGSNGGATVDHGSSVNSFRVKTGVHCHAGNVASNFAGNNRVTLFGCEEKTGECGTLMDSSCTDFPHDGNGTVLASDGKPPESIQDDSAAMSSVDAKKEVTEVGDGADHYQELKTSGPTLPSENNLSSSKMKVRSPLSDDDKNVASTNEKSVDNGVVVVTDAAAKCFKVEYEAFEESTSFSSSDRCDDEKTIVLEDQKLPHVICGKSEDTAHPSGLRTVPGIESKVEMADDMKSNSKLGHNEDQRYNLGSYTFDQQSEIARGKPEKKEFTGHYSSGSTPVEESPAMPVQEIELKSKICKSDGGEAPASFPNGSSLTAAGSDIMVKLDFDLNEGLPVDDGISGELVKLPVLGNSSSVHLPCPLPISISSMPGSLPASITVAAAAKGPFVPPENPLRIKGELGWKGSAATSAFRPAEPRKVNDMPPSDASLVDNSTSRHVRPRLDFDLNVPDQRQLDDMAAQISAPVQCSESGPGERSGGGLNLDLNRCDESPECQFSVSNSCRLEIPKLPGRSSLSGGLSYAESSTSRDFDLNNGPGPDEVGSEIAPHAKTGMSYLPSVPGVRVNNMELGNFSSWFPPGTSYSAIAMPPILPGRGEQSYPVIPAASSQRILGPPSGNPAFGPEIYRGPVLSSSPAVGFPPNTSFQYSGFPFETNFPVSSNSYSGVSTAFADSSSGGPLCFPAIPSQLMGSAHYPRHYVMGLPGGTSNVPESRRWGNQGLDLNAGPGITDIDRRDERLPSALRQLPLNGSQASADEQLKMYQMAGGVMKRKEPDSAWDGDRISYKHPSWQ